MAEAAAGIDAYERAFAAADARGRDPAWLRDLRRAGMERFRALDPLEVAASDPHLLVVARAGRFIVRTGRGKCLGDGRPDPGAGTSDHCSFASEREHGMRMDAAT